MPFFCFPYNISILKTVEVALALQNKILCFRMKSFRFLRSRLDFEISSEIFGKDEVTELGLNNECTSDLQLKLIGPERCPPNMKDEVK